MNAEFLQATAHGVGMQTGYVCSSVRAGDATVTNLQKFTEVKPLQGVEVNPLTCRIPYETPCFRNGAGSVLILRQAFRKLLIRLVKNQARRGVVLRNCQHGAHHGVPKLANIARPMPVFGLF